MTTQDALDYYAEPGAMTTAGSRVTALASLPPKMPHLLEAVQGLLVHEPGSARSSTGHLRTTHQILDHILAAEPGPLVEPRPPAHRLAGSCRHFTLLAVAALRAHGIPARARCGFARYFVPSWHIDHWVVEYWSARGIGLDARRRPAQSGAVRGSRHRIPPVRRPSRGVRRGR